MDVVLRLYHDVVGLQEVTEDNLDIIKNAILAKCHPSVGELCIFRSNSSTDSGANRPPIPIESIH